MPTTSRRKTKPVTQARASENKGLQAVSPESRDISGASHDVFIHDMSEDGRGIARLGEAVVFVEGALYGERVQIRIRERKKNYLSAIVTAVLEETPYKKPDPCPLLEPEIGPSCGGCPYGRLTYEIQLALKEKQVRDKISRISGLGTVPILPIIPSDRREGYRNKAVYRAAYDPKTGAGQVGFYAPSSHTLIACSHCAIQSAAANAAASVLASYLSFMADKKGHPSIETMTVKTAFASRQVMIILETKGEGLPCVPALADDFRKALSGAGFSLTSLLLKRREGKKAATDLLWGRGWVEEDLAGLRMEISEDSFYQVNPFQTEKLYQVVLRYAALTGTEAVYDLYCGVGSIGLFLASQARKIVGIEQGKAAVKAARRNAKRNGINKATYYEGKAENLLPILLQAAEEKPDIIILDPPRNGCHPDLLNAVLHAAPQKIIYVSCHPATLARDLKALTKGSYLPEKIQPVDMFPQTSAVETVALLSKLDVEKHISMK